MLPDLSASAEVLLESKQDATVAPLAAIFEGDGGGKPFVFLRSPEGWRRRDVELGVRSNVAAAVTSGLSKGDVVALDMPPQPSSGEGGNKSPS